MKKFAQTKKNFFFCLLLFFHVKICDILSTLRCFPTCFFTKKNEGLSNQSGFIKALLYGVFIFLVYLILSVPFHLIDSVNPDILNDISTNVWLNIFFFLDYKILDQSKSTNKGFKTLGFNKPKPNILLLPKLGW